MRSFSRPRTSASPYSNTSKEDVPMPVAAARQDTQAMSSRPNTSSGSGTSSLRAFAARSFHLGRSSNNVPPAPSASPASQAHQRDHPPKSFLRSDGYAKQNGRPPSPSAHRVQPGQTDYVDFDDFHRNITANPDSAGTSSYFHDRPRKSSLVSNGPPPASSSSRPPSGIPRRPSLLRRSSEARQRDTSKSPSRSRVSVTGTGSASNPAISIPQPPPSYLPPGTNSSSPVAQFQSPLQHPPSLRPRSMAPPPSAVANYSLTGISAGGISSSTQPRKPASSDQHPTSTPSASNSRRGSLLHPSALSDIHGPLALQSEASSTKARSSSRRRTLANANALYIDSSLGISSPLAPSGPIVSINTTFDSSKNMASHAKGSHTPSTPGKSPMRTSFNRQPLSASTAPFNKRLSSMPYVGGLGARTISPTDARRLKRMSMAATNPQSGSTPVFSPFAFKEGYSFENLNLHDIEPLPPVNIPISKQAELTPVLPSLSSKKFTTSTPQSISGRSSPESQRRSSQSISASSNPNTLRTGSSRASYIAMSRLPATKPSNHSLIHNTSTIDTEDEVPPVPAIPKAYESPKDVSEMFSASMSSLATPTISRPPDVSTVDATAEPDASRPLLTPSGPSGSTSHTASLSTNDQPQSSTMTNLRHRRGLTVGVGSDATKSWDSPHAAKRTLQPLRLPPLNLLPFNSTQRAERVVTMPAATSSPPSSRDGLLTPPPRRGAIMTPSTPLTASKAYFSQNRQNEDQDGSYKRSSSRPMARAVTADFMALRDALNSSTQEMPIPLPNLNNRQTATTPFSSSSVPRSGQDFLGALPFDCEETQKPEKTTGTSSLTPSFIADGVYIPKQSNNGDQSENPPSGHGSRKSSIAWTRIASKSFTNVATNSLTSTSLDRDVNTSKSGTLQAYSAYHPSTSTDSVAQKQPVTLPGGSLSSHPVNPSQPPRSIVTNASSSKSSVPKRKVSGPGLEAASSSIMPPTRVSLDELTSKPRSVIPSSAGRVTSSSVAESRSSRSRVSLPASKPPAPVVDKDQMAADRIMERLGSRRREVEAAARELDALTARARSRPPVNPKEALQRFHLNIFERGEIVDFDEVYFCGTDTAPKHVGDLNARNENFGYDDERGDYKIVFGDHLAYRYEVVDMLGKGSFGQVVRCIDHKLGKLVAVKIIRNRKRFHQQALVEVNILQKLHDWDPEHKHSTVRYTQSFYFRGHLCISTELLGINLYEFIKAHDFKGFSLTLIRRFTKQILSTLILLQSRRVIHCDLKPENILLCHPTKSEIKVIDFGSSCFENEKVYTYIQSRFYRSPEVILGMNYGISIDMWSVGCILAELLTGYPIFPGENEQEQLACIMEIFGPPEKHLIDKSTRRKVFFDSTGKPRVTVSPKGRRRRPNSKTLQHALKCDDEAFLDFVARCLRWDPDRRMKPDDAMQHEFITGIKQPRVSHRVRVPTGPSSAIGSSRADRDGFGALASNSPVKRIGISGGTYSLPTRSSASRVTTKPSVSSIVGNAAILPSGTAINSSRHASLSRPLPDPPGVQAQRHASSSHTIASATRSPAKLPTGHSRRHSAINMLGGMLKANPSTVLPSGNGTGRPARVSKNDIVSTGPAASTRV